MDNETTTTLNDLFEQAERRGARRERERVRMRRRKDARRELVRSMLGTRCGECGSEGATCYALREPGSNDSGGLSERGWLCRPEIVCGEMAMRVAMCRRCLSRRSNSRRRRPPVDMGDPVAVTRWIRASLGIV